MQYSMAAFGPSDSSAITSRTEIRRLMSTAHGYGSRSLAGSRLITLQGRERSDKNWYWPKQ